MGEKNVIKSILLNKAAKGLNGKQSGLEKLIKATKKYDDHMDPYMRSFINGLDKSIQTDGNFHKIFLRVGQGTSPYYRKKIVENLIYNEFILGRDKRLQEHQGDNLVPAFVVISPTMKCNLRCIGCYSGLYEKDGELSEAEMDKLLGDLRDLGIYFVVISGGEPYTKKDMLLRLFKKYNDMFFLTYTNGTFLDKETATALGKLGNVAPAISVEGWEEETDARRGAGTWKKIMAAMDNLRENGVLFGISVTATSKNQDVLTDDAFIEYFIKKGAIFGWYFMFMPVGKDPILELVPTPAQRKHYGERVREMRSQHPIFLADFWNDGDVIGGCLAGGRVYMHILSSGNVEPCVFAHFGIDNIRDKPLREIINSPFFKEIRHSFPYNENGNLKRPCMIIDNPDVLRNAVHKHFVHAGHTHSEDLINNPDVVKWIDSYSTQFAALTDPEWDERIKNPNDQWYKEGDLYKKLFQYQTVTPEKE